MQNTHNTYIAPVALDVEPAEGARHARQIAHGLDLVLPEPQLLLVCWFVCLAGGVGLVSRGLGEGGGRG